MYYGKEFLSSLFNLLLLLPFSTSLYTLTPSQIIKDGDFLVSNREMFALGFFSPGNSRNRYLGIWFNKISEGTDGTVVWVANRDNPINDTSGVLSIDKTGNLVLRDQIRHAPVWSTNVSATNMTNMTDTYSAQLLDSGNLLLFQGGSKRIVAWQSFDYPSNTLLPYMKIGLDRRTGLNRFLTSWKSPGDPGTGDYTYRMDDRGSPQVFLDKGLVHLWRTGPWNGVRWSGIPETTSKFIINISFVDNQDEVYYMHSLYNASALTRLVLNESGVIERFTWQEGERRWVGFVSAPKDKCDFYGHCGPFGECNPYEKSEDFECTCFPGFEPKLARDWYLRDGLGGCVRKSGRQVCGNGEGFVKVARVKVPDTSIMMRVDKSLGMKACEELCLKNCSCMGYTTADIRGGGSGCIAWYGSMIDTTQFSDIGHDQDMYIRVDAIELAQYSKKSKSFHSYQIVAVVVTFVAVIFIIILVMKKRKGTRKRQKQLFIPNTTSTPIEASSRGKEIDEGGTNVDLPFFALSTIVSATDNFSFTNKLGQGGFGAVYKGQLHNGQEIAIKRLSKTSGQGIEEFKNEVTLIAKLQHRNLVKLLGCCIEKEEKILVYEYMPNKGLDSVIFDKAKGSLVDWRKRFEITLGIARGMLYLHQDSRLRIIHRDLKASNVLLDASMSPKISDFGMAKMFGGDQIEANTNRVVGTYGYMSPEYAMEGLFSIKSDVFSFGVLLLEIISGRKNTSYYKENSMNLTGHVWDLWREGKALDIVDSSLGDSYKAHEVLRCIHIGLLCVQEFAIDRPTMSEVAFMLCHETTLPSPNQPAFIFKKVNHGPDSSSASVGAKSVNEVTMTELEPR